MQRRASVMERMINAAVFMFHLALCGSSLIKTPSNKAVIAGQRMEMECRPDIKSRFQKWNFWQVGNQSPRAIVTNDNKDNMETSSTSSGFGFRVDSDSVILYSNSTLTRDAGIYICQGETRSSSAEFQYSAQLIVLESEPICATNVTTAASFTDRNYILMQCRVNFRGNWAPTVEWRQHLLNGSNNEGRTVSTLNDSVVIQSASVTSTLIVRADSTYRNSYYSCRTYFTQHTGRLQTNATNIPDFIHEWISISISNPTTTSVASAFSNTYGRSITSSFTDTHGRSMTFIFGDTYGDSVTLTFVNRPTYIKEVISESTVKKTDLTTILLIAGICLVACTFIAAVIGVVYCALLNRKATATKESHKLTNALVSEYEPHSVTDVYDTIEEVDEKDDNTFHKFPPRHGPLPSPGYTAMTTNKTQAPGVYSRMEHKKKSNVDDKKLQSDIARSSSIQSKFSNEGLSDSSALPARNYIDFDTQMLEDISAKVQESPSSYPVITGDPLQFGNKCKLAATFQRQASASAHHEITNEYLKPNVNYVLKANQTDNIPSSYITTMEMKSDILP